MVGLHLLAEVDVETGEESGPAALRSIARSGFGCPVVLQHAIGAAEALAMPDDPTCRHEGVVLAWPRPGRTPLRVKVKLDTYKRYHRFLSGLTKRRIWEHLKDGLPWDDLASRCPDEFHGWLEATRAQLSQARYEYLAQAQEVVTEARWHEARKDQAEVIKRAPRELRGLAFAVLDGREVNDMLWKMVEPEPEFAPFAVSPGE